MEKKETTWRLTITYEISAFTDTAETRDLVIDLTAILGAATVAALNGRGPADAWRVCI